MAKKSDFIPVMTKQRFQLHCMLPELKPDELTKEAPALLNAKIMWELYYDAVI